MALPNVYTNMALNENLEDSGLAGATINQYQRVYLDSTGKLQPANNIADYSIGVARSNIANNNIGAIRLHLPMQFGLANANINVGDAVAVATNGLITPTLTNATWVVGVAKTPTNAGSNVPLVYYGVRDGRNSA